eukprot:COSAG06_NODE_13937_length_1204_cov_1.952941_1_plen_150_part_10
MKYPIGGPFPQRQLSQRPSRWGRHTLAGTRGAITLRLLTLRLLTLRISHPPPRESRALSRKKQNTTNQTVLLFKPLPHPNSAQLKPTLTSIHSNQTHPFPIAFPKKLFTNSKLIGWLDGWNRHKKTAFNCTAPAQKSRRGTYPRMRRRLG